MGISTKVYTIYGWKIKSNDAIYTWLEEELDGSYPKEVISDYDFENLYVGAIMFESGDARYGEMYGENSFSEEEAEDQLTKWIIDNQDFYIKVCNLCPELGFEPKFISWVNYS